VVYTSEHTLMVGATNSPNSNGDKDTSSTVQKQVFSSITIRTSAQLFFDIAILSLLQARR